MPPPAVASHTEYTTYATLRVTPFAPCYANRRCSSFLPEFFLPHDTSHYHFHVVASVTSFLQCPPSLCLHVMVVFLFTSFSSCSVDCVGVCAVVSQNCVCGEGLPHNGTPRPEYHNKKKCHGLMDTRVFGRRRSRKRPGHHGSNHRSLTRSMATIGTVHHHHISFTSPS